MVRVDRNVLDAFFLGKALAEAINGRIESGVGEFLSTIGRLQAEQQKLVEEFQEDVLGRAKKAKEKAAHEAVEAQGIVTSTTESITPVTTTNGVTAVSSTNATTLVTSDKQDPGDEDTGLGVPIDD
ncbi:hypothetical protein D8674_027072 [Pyrus ussuriensis x Pyrus communis]|uniref:Uncharacterized protein n=1 Tax=Pyrus ussuriensis x Pyrus communis TaxID=2448454 RepID=A0A5N5I9S5_9ROSA|nr:hypothetical protein D8674_027072 [Pyrus ussuriensis x Pyrus communis]